MKKLLSLLMAAALCVVLAASFTVFAAADTANDKDLVLPNKKITVDGKKSSGEWDGAPSITLDMSNTELTIITEGAEVDNSTTVKITLAYDETYLYILEERSSEYISTAFGELETIKVYRGDCVDYFFALYIPDAVGDEQRRSTCDMLLTPNCAKHTYDDTQPLLLFRNDSLFSSAWAKIANTNEWSVKSTMTSDNKSSVIEAAIKWDRLFQGNSLHDSKTAEYKKYVSKFAAEKGFAVKFAAIVHAGNTNTQHCYSMAYGVELDKNASATAYGTSISGNDIANWTTLYMGEKNTSATGQIDLDAIVAKGLGGGGFNYMILVYIGIGIVALVVIAIIIMRIFNIKIGAVEEESDDDEDEDDDDDDDDEDDDDDDDEEEDE